VDSAYEIVNPRGGNPALLVCDHASPRIPGHLGNLGLAPTVLEQHVAWDIGAADLTRGLAAALDVPAVLAAWSRLVVDCNRALDTPSAFPTQSDGMPIPGNESLDPAERERRAERFHRPYHAAIERLVAELRERVERPAFIALHSFTPRMNGCDRPWEVGVLWDRDDRIAAPLLAALRHRGLCVGDNEPYSGRHPTNYTVDRHGAARLSPHVSIEVRQDLIADPAGVARWVNLLAMDLGPILAGLANAP
jgi:predicted N-formylglutamate amidohydrolase